MLTGIDRSHALVLGTMQLNCYSELGKLATVSNFFYLKCIK